MKKRESQVGEIEKKEEKMLVLIRSSPRFSHPFVPLSLTLPTGSSAPAKYVLLNNNTDSGGERGTVEREVETICCKRAR